MPESVRNRPTSRRSLVERLRLFLKFKPLTLLAGWRHKLIGKHASAVLTETWNGRILVPAGDLFIGRRLAYRGAHDRGTILRLLELVDADSDVLVVGAHVGTVLIPLARACRSAVGVEANPEIFDLLSASVTLNDLDNVRLLNLAASDVRGELPFVANRVNSGGSKVYGDGERRYEFFYDDPETVTVAAERLDDALEGRAFDLVLLDVEGSEYRAMKGMPDILSGAKRLVLEVIPNHVDNVARVSREEFLAAIPEAFTRAWVLDSSERRTYYAREEVEGLFDALWAASRGANLVFEVERTYA